MIRAVTEALRLRNDIRDAHHVNAATAAAVLFSLDRGGLALAAAGTDTDLAALKTSLATVLDASPVARLAVWRTPGRMRREAEEHLSNAAAYALHGRIRLAIEAGATEAEAINLATTEVKP